MRPARISRRSLLPMIQAIGPSTNPRPVNRAHRPSARITPPRWGIWYCRLRRAFFPGWLLVGYLAWRLLGGVGRERLPAAGALDQLPQQLVRHAQFTTAIGAADGFGSHDASLASAASAGPSRRGTGRTG